MLMMAGGAVCASDRFTLVAAALKHSQGDTPHASTQLSAGYFHPCPFSQFQTLALDTQPQMMGLKFKSYILSCLDIKDFF